MASDDYLNNWIASNLNVERDALKQWEYDYKTTDDGERKVIWVDEVPDFVETEEMDEEIFTIIDPYPYDNEGSDGDVDEEDSHDD